MSVAIAAATALLYFSSQVIVHAAAAFEAAFVFTSFRSLRTGPAASTQAYSATMRIWHAAAAPAAAVKGFFNHDLLAEPAAASEYEVVDLLQPAVAASAAAKGNDGCLSDLAKHVFDMVLRLIWSLVCAFGLCAIIDSGFGPVLSSILRAVLGKDMPLSHGKEKIQSFKLKIIEGVQERMILQALTSKALTQADSAKVIASKTVLILRVSATLSRVRMGTTPTVACRWARGRLQDGWTSPSVSTHFSTLRRSAGLDSLSPSLPLALAS